MSCRDARQAASKSWSERYENELLTAFPGLQVRVYRELDGRACLLAFRPTGT